MESAMEGCTHTRTHIRTYIRIRGNSPTRDTENLRYVTAQMVWFVCRWGAERRKVG